MNTSLFLAVVLQLFRIICVFLFVSIEVIDGNKQQICRLSLCLYRNLWYFEYFVKITIQMFVKISFDFLNISTCPK